MSGVLGAVVRCVLGSLSPWPAEPNLSLRSDEHG
jgi:hypothetical protein